MLCSECMGHLKESRLASTNLKFWRFWIGRRLLDQGRVRRDRCDVSLQWASQPVGGHAMPLPSRVHGCGEWVQAIQLSPDWSLRRCLSHHSEVVGAIGGVRRRARWLINPLAPLAGVTPLLIRHQAGVQLSLATMWECFKINTPTPFKSPFGPIVCTSTCSSANK